VTQTNKPLTKTHKMNRITPSRLVPAPLPPLHVCIRKTKILQKQLKKNEKKTRNNTKTNNDNKITTQSAKLNCQINGAGQQDCSHSSTP